MLSKVKGFLPLGKLSKRSVSDRRTGLAWASCKFPSAQPKYLILAPFCQWCPHAVTTVKKKKNPSQSTPATIFFSLIVKTKPQSSQMTRGLLNHNLFSTEEFLYRHNSRRKLSMKNVQLCRKVVHNHHPRLSFLQSPISEVSGRHSQSSELHHN